MKKAGNSIKKLGAIPTIYRAFFGKTTIDKDIWNQRLEACNSCPFNSRNATELSKFNKLRSFLMEKPYCTICGCFIKEKTSSETEVCALYEQGEKPKWNRIKLEIIKPNEMNIINKTPELVNVDVSQDVYKINFGEVKRSALKDIQFELTASDNTKSFLIRSISPGCGGCNKVRFEKVADKTYNVTVITYWDRLRGNFSKTLTVDYTVGDQLFRRRIVLNGIIIE